MEKLTVQSDLCDGCLDCEHTCNGIYGISRISIHEIEDSYYPIVCQHCEDAPCKIICPTGAMDIERVNEDKCIACGFCVMVCPFGAVQIHEKKAQKCDQCLQREEGPVCIKACSKRALNITDPETIRLNKQKAFLNKVVPSKNKSKESNFINLITSGIRAKKAFDEKD